MKSPLLFHHVYKSYLWGGDRIAKLYSRTGTPAVCAESWEISAHPDGESIVAAGRFAGQTLASLTRHFGEALVGTRAPDPKKFPLLFKIIDARQKLSLQVHPNNINGPIVGGEPKTEMWYVLGIAPGAYLYAGLADNVKPAELRAAIEAGKAEPLLRRFPVRTGEAFFIPGGLVHAIGEGCLIYEIQQSSNTTYRLYDWDRRGPDGSKRPLHVEKGLQTIDWSLPAPRPILPSESEDAEIVSCDYFKLRRLVVNEPRDIELDGSTFQALFAESGVLRVTSDDETITLATGASALIPAAAPGYRLEAKTPGATVLATSL